MQPPRTLLNTHLVAHPNGAVVPADEPAVAAARADHLAAGGAVYAGAYLAHAALPALALLHLRPSYRIVSYRIERKTLISYRYRIESKKSLSLLDDQDLRMYKLLLYLCYRNSRRTQIVWV